MKRFRYLKVQLAGRSISPAAKWRLLKGQGWKCKYCDCKLLSTECEADHFIPFSANPETNLENIYIVCYDCNRAKRDHIFNSLDDVRRFCQAEKCRLSDLFSPFCADSSLAEVLQPEMPHDGLVGQATKEQEPV